MTAVGIEAKKESRSDHSAPHEEDPNMEIIELSPFAAHAYDPRFKLELSKDPKANEELLRMAQFRRIESVNRELAYDILVAYRSDDAFWRGDYDPGKMADVPATGSIDLSFLSNAIKKLWSKKMARRRNRNTR